MLSDYGRLKFAWAEQQLTQRTHSKLRPPEGSQTYHSHWKKNWYNLTSKHLVENIPNDKCLKNFLKIRKNKFYFKCSQPVSFLKHQGKLFML